MSNYDGPGTQAYWDRRKEAFALIAVIGKDIRALTIEDEQAYWPALLATRDNETARSILRAQGREAILFPVLGDIPDMPEEPIDIEAEVQNRLGPRPTDPERALDWDLEAKWTADGLIDHYYGGGEASSSVHRYVVESGIVRIETSRSDDGESSSFRLETYLNGQLHDINGEPALTVQSHHRIPSEAYLDEGYTVSYRHGVETGRVDNDDLVVARWSPAQREAFGAGDYEKVA